MASGYEDFLRRAEARRTGAVAESEATIGVDEAARRARYRRVYGTEAPDAAEEAAAEARIEAERAAQQSPVLARFASENTGLALLRGNMSNMAQTAQAFEQQPPREGFFDAMGSFFSQSFGGEDSNGNNYWRDDISARNVGDSLAAGTVGIGESAAGTLQSMSESRFSYNTLTSPVRAAFAWFPELFAQISGLEGGADVFLPQAREEFGEAAAALRPRARTQAGAAILQGFESLPYAAVAMIGGAQVAATRGSSVLLGTTAARLGVTVPGATAAGIAGTLTYGQSYGDARDAGLAPGAASGFALRDGLIEAGTEVLPFSQLLPGASGTFLTRVSRALVEDVAGEQAAAFLQDLNRFTTIEQDQGATWDDFWAARGPAAFDALFGAVVGSGTMGAATGALEFASNKMGRRAATAAAVDGNTAFFERLNQLAQADAVLTRDVGTFEAFIARAAEGTAAETIFIDAGELATVLDQSGLTGDQVTEAFNYTPSEIAAAVARGDDLAIPVEAYASRVASTPLSEQLLPHLRLSPDDMSFTQAQTFLQGAKEEFAADAERALEEGLAGNARATSRDNVRQAMREQLNTARRFTDQTNEVYASVYAAFADTQGTKLGMTAEEFAAKYPLFVQSGEVAQATYDQPTGDPTALDPPAPKGDGRRFRDFFAGITRGESGAPDTRNAVRLFDTSGVADFEAEYTQHMGKFDDHIGASIPGFREVQIAVGAALTETIPQNGRLLDIAGSEGALAKGIAARRPDVETVVLDPNPGMRDTFTNTSQVPNARFVMEAFTDTAADQGQQLWDEDGVPILGYTPDAPFDVVHEAMGFQFIHNDRAAQVARVKQLMTDNGIAIFEEKFVPGDALSQEQWQQNEDVKDEFKLQYFNIEDLAAKKAAILEGKAEEQRTVGMNDLMVSPGVFENVLSNNFRFAAQFWDSGNFKGYVASDSREALDAFLSSLVDTTTPFSTVQTPRVVAGQGAVSSFKTWFGDSKVVNPDGTPRVVYHGTAAEFDTFRTKGKGFASALGMPVEVDRNGVFFAADRALADDYTLRNGKVKPGAKVMEVYLRIEKPFDMRDDALSQLMDTPEGAAFEEETGLSLNGLYQMYQEDRWEEFDGGNGAELIARLKGAGYDGAILTENIEGTTATDRTAYVVFDAEQVKSVDNIGTFDPSTANIYNQSAVELQTLPLGVQGTGPGGRVRNWDLGEALALRHRLRYGRALDPTQPDDYAVALEAMVEDYENQQTQADNGETWYSDDIAEAMAVTARILPELAEPVRRDIFLTAVALLSPQQGPIDNWANAIDAFTGYSKTGRFALEKPGGQQFGVASHRSGLLLFQHLIETQGEIGALVWLSDEHTGREMEAVRRASGLFSNKKDKYLPKEMNFTESKIGAYLFGPKVGDFMLNSTGMDQNAVTVDLWMARTYNRVIGRLTDVNEKQAAEGGLADAMRGKAERAIAKTLVRDAAARAGIAPSAMQAALWYFEQRLYRNHGINSGSTSFSDAAREAALNRGIAVDGVTAQGSATRSDEDALADLDEGVRVTADTELNPLDAFKRESFYPTRAVRFDDGTVYADIPDFYPDRQAKLAEQLGAPAVVAVNANDPRLAQGVPLWHTRPPLNADGTITIHHWGPEGVATTDPKRWGESGTLPASERSAISSSLPRTYFGIASGQPGGYIIEFPTRTQYEARVSAEMIYDVANDPDGLKPAKNVNELERKIADAGYLGYWTADNSLGLVATMFEPVAVQPAGAQVLFQDAVFFSALERALESNPTTKASAAQWSATLQKTPGIKVEELEWTGLLDFLEMQENPVTRDQLLELVRGAGIRVDEVVLGDPLEVFRASQTDEGDFGVYNEDGDLLEWFDNPDDADARRYEMQLTSQGGPTQFSSWTTDPQNETYRELLITMPVGSGRNPNRAPSTHWDTDGVIAHARFMDKTDADGKRVLFIEEVQSDWHQKGRDQGYQTPVDPAAVAAAEKAQMAAATRVSELNDTLGLQMQAQYDAYLVSAFENGGDALRAQAEDDYGYIAPLNGEISINKAVRFLREFPVLDLVDLDVVREFEVARLRYNEAVQALSAASTTTGIPNAPFRTDWPALVMKRMIRWAAEHGYERIAWTTGEQQAARYNLSQAVGSLQFQGRTEDGRLLVQMDALAAGQLAENGLGEQTNDYGGGLMTLRMSEDQTREAFGNDIAQKIIDGEQGDRLEQEDLYVGGEGMKQFYDRNLVNITNKLVKKYGAKVGPVSVVDAQTTRLGKQQAEFNRDTEDWTGLSRQRSALGRVLMATEDAIAGGVDPESYLPAQRPEGILVRIDKIAASMAEIEAQWAADDAALVATQQQPGFDITPELADAAMGGFPLFQRDRGPRGQVAFAKDITSAPSVITLLRGADLSTFVHELGHYFFEVTNHMASQAGAPAEVIADRDAMLKYLGVKSISAWQRRTPAQRREGHERMARSFEAYLFEGRAPSIELRGLFGKLRSWMMQVYRTITGLNVELTPEVRGVFDRMLASEDAIRDAQADAEMQPLFTEKPEGMTDAEWEEYNTLDRDATSEAAKSLESRSLRDMRYAGKATARELKRLQREMADQRADVREEVAAEMGRLPVYQAITLFRTGKLDNAEFEGPAKLNTEIVREVMQLDDAPLPDAFRGMTSPDGIHPQQMSELFGYSSANHMLNDLLFASPFNDAVEAETDSRMRERYGEMNTPQELEEAARAAVHNEVRGRFVATELAALQNAPGKRRVLANAARTMADAIIARLRIRDIRPSKYEAAERRAARDLLKAGTQDIDAAIRMKRNQLLQFYLAKSAHAAREETQDAVRYLKKFDAKGTRENIDVAYLDQIDQILEAFDFRQVSNRESDRRKALADWVKQMEEQGFEPAFDAETLELIQRKPWRELTVEEMRGVLDAVRNIEHLGRLTKKLLTAKDKADLAEAAAEMAETVRVNAFRDVEPIVGAKTWWEKVQAGAADFFVMHRKVASMVYVFDGNKYGGVFWERFIRPMNEAGDRETVMTREANVRLANLFRPISQENTTRREFEPSIGKSISLEDRLMVALNMGNAANLQRLMDGDGWTYEQVQSIIAPLTATHWDFVENAWREIDNWWPQIAAKQVRVTGIAPEKVEAMPFQVEVDGQLRYIPGGYFPIKYDTDRSSKADADESAEVLRQMTRGLYTSAQTRRGHTKERVDEVKGRPLRKDFGVIFQHTGQVIHDLAWHEYLIDANRLLKHKAIDSAIRDHYGTQTLRWIRKALEDIAVGDLPAQNAFEKSIRHIRTGVSIASMGWSVWTSLLQPIGLTQSFARIGTRHVMRGIGDLFSNPVKMNEKIEWIYSVSPFMLDRSNTMQREINEIRNRIGAKSPLGNAVSKVVPEGVSNAVGDSYFYMLGKAQLMADLPTWLGQYHKSLEEGEPQDRAVAMADQAVIDSQSSGQIKDLAGIQRGSETLRLFTNFYSYFSATYNLMADRTANFRRVGASDLPYFMVDMTLLTVLPATITAIMYQLLRGGEDEEEDWLKIIAEGNLQYFLGLMVGVREVGSALYGAQGYQGPAGTRFFAELGRLGNQVSQGESDEALFRATNATAGILLHYPSGQLDRTTRGLMAYAEGEAGPQAVAVGPPVGQ